MYPFAQDLEHQLGRRRVKSPRAGELTGSSWIKLHFATRIHENRRQYLSKNGCRSDIKAWIALKSLRFLQKSKIFQKMDKNSGNIYTLITLA